MINPNLSWFKIDKRVEMVFIPNYRIEHIPVSEILIAIWWATAELMATFPDAKGKKFYLIQGYEVWYGDKERVHATYQLPFPKIVTADWLLRKVRSHAGSVADIIRIPPALDHSVHRLILPIENRPPIISMMYSEVGIKGGLKGIEALKLAKKQFPELTAKLFGIYQRPPNLPDWIEYYREPPRRMLVEEIYNRSSIYFLPSVSEGWPLTGAEAMACGCALVSADNHGVKEYAVSEKSVILTDGNSPADMAAGILRLLTDDVIRVKIAKSGYQAIQQYTWESNTSMLLDFLNQHLDGKSPETKPD